MKKKPVNIMLPITLVKKFDAWIAKQPMTPTRSSAIEGLIRQTLEGKS